MSDIARTKIETPRHKAEMVCFKSTEAKIEWSLSRLRKHADYQRVYKAGRKQFTRQMSYFFALRPTLGPDGTSLRHSRPDTARVGLTVSKAMGNAVRRNRIKRRMREAVRRHLGLLGGPVDVILHPRPNVLDLNFATLEREVAAVFRAIEKSRVLAAKKQVPE